MEKHTAVRYRDQQELYFKWGDQKSLSEEVAFEQIGAEIFMK